MSDIAIIGAGMAGLTAARHLSAAGHAVTLFDKGSKPGGRLATRRGKNFIFNHGCQFFAPRDRGFAAFMDDMGARHWPEAGQHRFAGVPDMASLAEAAASGLTVHLATRVEGFHRAGDAWELSLPENLKMRFATLVLAIPAAQAAALLAGAAHPFADALAPVHLAPCWAVMLGFGAEIAGPDTLRPETGPLAWIARENSRPGQAPGPTAYTLHATPGWSTAHLDDAPDSVIAALTAAFAALTGITAPPNHAAAHRWRYALADRPLGRPCLWDPAIRLGLAGDWCLDGKLEAAYLSGKSLAETMT
jgi:predicted NAD/FAD-dependent oxidoreductase